MYCDIQPILGVFGLLGNLLSILILSAHQMKNSFNRLLVALAIYAYLLPKVIYPLNNISLCCSIYTTIVIAFERFGDFYNPGELTVYARYTAVCNPYLYKENNTAHRVTNRVLSFMVPVIIFSVLINIPRYFETVIISETVNITTADNETVQEERVYYEVTPLRMDANYIRYSCYLLLGTYLYD